ncbi:hypothetical protein, partial [Alkalilimnicola ehrlichii]|uniref:hypothetical protein n=1 Tax=Alkalilimnicola ehrlichii TaxID=351052 RepID=UPI0011C01BEE
MFDTAGARNRVLTNVILAVRDLVVPVEPSSVVTNDLLQFLDMIETLSDLAVQTGGEALAVRGFYFNRVERNTRAHRDNMEDVREGLAETAYRVSAPCIPKTTLIEKQRVRARRLLLSFRLNLYPKAIVKSLPIYLRN